MLSAERTRQHVTTTKNRQARWKTLCKDSGHAFQFLPNETTDLLSWIVYILECADKTLYTGITNNLEHRLHAHENGKGAKYTRGRGPFSVLYTETLPTRSHALHREAQIKRFDPEAKRNLVSANTLP